MFKLNFTTFEKQDVIGKLQAAAAASAAAQQGQQQQQQQQQAAQSQTEAEQPKPESQPAPQQAESRQEEAAAAAAQPTLPVDPAAQAACPRPLLPVLNACPPCSPTDCFCADGKKLTLEDQAKAYEVINQTYLWTCSFVNVALNFPKLIIISSYNVMKDSSTRIPNFEIRLFCGPD